MASIVMAHPTSIYLWPLSLWYTQPIYSYGLMSYGAPSLYVVYGLYRYGAPSLYIVMAYIVMAHPANM